MAASRTTTGTLNLSPETVNAEPESLTRSGRNFKFVARSLQKTVTEIRVQAKAAKSRKRAHEALIEGERAPLVSVDRPKRQSKRIAGLPSDGKQLADEQDKAKPRARKAQNAKTPQQKLSSGEQKVPIDLGHSASKRVKTTALPSDAAGQILTPAPEDLLENTKRECLTCLESLPLAEAVELPCAHTYCSECFATLVRLAIAAEATFPPRCCDNTPISRSILHRSCPEELWRRYMKKDAEYAVPADKRIYCSRDTCGRFIDPKLTSNNAVTCRTCRRRTCTICKDKAHGKKDCPEDEDRTSFLQLARVHGWKQCSRCQSMVERLLGCDHMSRWRHHIHLTGI